MKLPNNSKIEDASPRRPARPGPTPAREPPMDADAARASHVSSATKHFEALNTWTSDNLGSHTPHSPLSVAPKEPPKKKKPFKKAQKFLSSLIRGRSSLHHCQAHPATTEWKFGCWDRLFSGVKGAMVLLPMQMSVFTRGHLSWFLLGTAQWTSAHCILFCSA